MSFLFTFSRPNDYRIFDLLADCYSLLGLPEHAAQQLAKAVSLLKAPLNLWKKLGLIYRELDKREKYITTFAEYFSKYLAKSPDMTIEVTTMPFFLVSTSFSRFPMILNMKPHL